MVNFMPAHQKKKSSPHFNKRALSPRERGERLLQQLSGKNPHEVNINKTLSLITADTDLNMKDEDGYTPLMLASLKGLDKVVQKLLKHNVDLNVQSKLMKESALHLAIDMKQYNVFKLLVEAKADLNLQRDDGFTPLMCAACCEFSGFTSDLIQAGANIFLKSNSGQDAYDTAVDWEHHKVSCIISEEMAKQLNLRAIAMDRIHIMDKTITTPDVTIKPRPKIKF